ncbi:hypothetical protein BGM26_10990 [Bacillus sp. FJAT-29790]|uniref:hypothetical protein n=1 Tax=Bacillus sp. FJAT-29790 TaxID=1895002 RepID=UPI001C249723|nr:hypothetical protein [Bacillus sp. FJAT-29790]MBU8879511.1 hypothetical protein [Bacillus sp. FJAT-29790]
MKAFNGLFFKELKLTKNWFMVGMALLILAVMAGIGLMRYFNEPNVFAVISIMILSAHAFYLPLYLLSSLNIEGQSQGWLHNPNSGTKLFLAKIAAGLLFFLVSLFIALCVAKWGIDHAEGLSWIEGEHFPTISLMGAGLTLGSIFMGIWVLFYWSLFHSLKNVPIVSSFRWPILVGVWLLLSVIWNYIQHQPFYQKLKKIGVIQLDSIQSIKYEVSKNSASAAFIEGSGLTIMNGIIYTAIVILVFYIAVWLLERKVEV